VADVNGDGIPDLVFATPTGISERLGNGDGTFQGPSDVNFAAGTPVTVVGAGDFTNDGRLDAVVANVMAPGMDARAHAVSVLLNQGDGTFATAPAFATGQFPTQVVAGDFTGSGLPDLVTADSDHIHLLPNNGDGTFASPITLANGGFSELIARDFNGDGNLDLAALTRTSQGLLVEVFLGNGDGTFRAPRISFVGSASLIPAQMVAGDFEGDGDLDLAVVSNDETVGHFQGLVTVLRGNGDGTFQVSDTHQVAGPFTIVTGLVAADFNGDGNLDLVETNRDGTVNVLLGNGDGTFQEPVVLQPGVFPTSAAVGDFNGDGIPDLAVADLNAGTVSVLLGNGDGTFQAPVSIAVGTGASSILAGYFNGDGVLDLAMINDGSNAVSVLRGNADGTFQNPVSYLVGDTPRSLVAADFNGDGSVDLATANFHSACVTVLLNRNDGPGAPGAAAETSSIPLARTVQSRAVDARIAAAPLVSLQSVVIGQQPTSAAVAAVAPSRPTGALPQDAQQAAVDAAILPQHHKQHRGEVANAAELADFVGDADSLLDAVLIVR
jgi:hypothetical protein